MARPSLLRTTPASQTRGRAQLQKWRSPWSANRDQRPGCAETPARKAVEPGNRRGRRFLHGYKRNVHPNRDKADRLRFAVRTIDAAFIQLLSSSSRSEQLGKRRNGAGTVFMAIHPQFCGPSGTSKSACALRATPIPSLIVGSGGPQEQHAARVHEAVLRITSSPFSRRWAKNWPSRAARTADRTLLCRGTRRTALGKPAGRSPKSSATTRFSASSS